MSQVWGGGSHSFPFPMTLHVSLKKGGQGCSHVSREEHPRAMGGSRVPPELPLRRIPEQEWEQRGTQAVFLGQHHPWELGIWLSSAPCVPAHVCTSPRSSIGHSSGPWTSRAIFTSLKQRGILVGSASPEPPFLITVIVALASSGAGCSPWLQIRREESGPWGRSGKGCEPPGIPSGSCGGNAASERSQTQQGPWPAPGVPCRTEQSRVGVPRAGARPFTVLGAFQRILLALGRFVVGNCPGAAGTELGCCWKQFGMFGAAEQLLVPEELQKILPFPGDGHGRAPGWWHRSVAAQGRLPWCPHPVSRRLPAGSAHFPSPPDPTRTWRSHQSPFPDPG